VGPGVTITPTDDGALEIGGLTAEQIGDAAAVNGIALHELTPVQVSLEEAFMDVTRGDVEYHGLVGATEPREPEEVAV
jgi:ABC-2 type transport system ATP-binding protein